VIARRLCAVLATLVITIQLLASGWGDPCSATITILQDQQRVTAIARCTFQGFSTTQPDTSVTVYGEMSLTPDGATKRCNGPGSCGMSTEANPLKASTAYTATGTFTASQAFVDVGGTKTVTDSKTTPAPERPRTDPPVVDPVEKCQGGEPGYGTVCSPIVINLGTGSYQLSGPDHPVAFDLDGDGQTERTTWTSEGSLLAFLALDRNANANIDSGLELFGDATKLRSGQRGRNGYEALSEFDENGDGAVDRDDPVWPLLLLWTDTNHDGSSQAGEVQHISASRIEALETAHHWTGRRDTFGNVFGYQSLVRFDHATRPAYDVYFRLIQ
jgi:hypothetical protein